MSSLLSKQRTCKVIVALVLAMVLIVICAAVAVASAKTQAVAYSGRMIAAPSHVESTDAQRILVSFRADTSAKSKAKAHASLGARILGELGQINVQVIEVPKAIDPAKLLETYRKNPNVVFAELEGIAVAAVTPDDPYYGRQWAPAYNNSPAAWDVTSGCSSVIIAVLDTGVQLSHPELAGRLLPGYDFVNSDADPSDDGGHGTSVAGIAAATGNNTLGIAGMDWNCRVLPVKVLNSAGNGTTTSISQGIIYAADQGAHVINISFNTVASSTLYSAIQYASSKGCVIVAASGNEGSSTIKYPAGYPEVIAVGSVYRDVRSSFSNYGSYLDVVAPGETIDTIAAGSTYGRMSGTSASAPFVAGLAALVKAAAPSLSGVEIAQIITSTARDLGASGWDQYYGHGHINAQAALTAAAATAPAKSPTTTTTAAPTTTTTLAPAPTTTTTLAPTTTTTVAPTTTTTQQGDTTPPVVTFVYPTDGSVVAPNLIIVRADATDENGVARVEFYLNGKLIGSDTSAPYTVNWNAKRLLGAYTLKAVAYDAAGNSAEASATVTIKK